jgi:hypothetical protein
MFGPAENEGLTLALRAHSRRGGGANLVDELEDAVCVLARRDDVAHDFEALVKNKRPDFEALAEFDGAVGADEGTGGEPLREDVEVWDGCGHSCNGGGVTSMRFEGGYFVPMSWVDGEKARSWRSIVSKIGPKTVVSACGAARTASLFPKHVCGALAT